VLKLHSNCYFVCIVCFVIQSAQTPTLKYQILQTSLFKNITKRIAYNYRLIVSKLLWRRPVPPDFKSNDNGSFQAKMC